MGSYTQLVKGSVKALCCGQGSMCPVLLGYLKCLALPFDPWPLSGSKEMAVVMQMDSPVTQGEKRS